jgi:STE24 endopeptidase
MPSAGRAAAMNESKATLYQRSRRRADALAVVSSGAALVTIAVSPAAGWLARATETFGRGLSAPAQGAVALLLFVVAVVLTCELAAAAARLTRRPVDRLSPAPSVEAILGAQLHAAAELLPAALFAAVVVRLATLLAGQWWWLAAAVVLAGGLVGAARGAPALVARLARTRPLGRADLASALTGLGRRAGVPIAGIDEVGSESAAGLTAVVSGLGRSRRVFLSSELARDWSDDEITVVVAHEIAHHAHRDLARTLALDAAIVAAALAAAHAAIGIAGPWLGLRPADLAALPLIAAVAGSVWILATPLRHAESRRQERLADALALVLTGGADAFASAIRRLGERRLAEERPSTMTRWLFHRHPSVTERLAMADTYRQSGTRH